MAHHDVITCNKPTTLRQQLRKPWSLPNEDMFKCTGENWVLVLLDQCNAELRAKLIFLWWRSWHLRNNAIFGDGKCGIQQSANFIQSYLSTFVQANSQEAATDAKGKKCLMPPNAETSKKRECTQAWTKPNPGWLKMNVDAGLCAQNNTGSWGAILRDAEGNVILSAWGFLQHCLDATTAECIAMLEGAKAIVAYTPSSVIVEGDNALVINELKLEGPGKSMLSNIFAETKNTLQMLPGFEIRKINRSANVAAHGLAKFASLVGSGGLLLGSVPPCVLDQTQIDCKHIGMSNDVS
jgi:ribonuclease HI